jgi:hypothetical protein
MLQTHLLEEMNFYLHPIEKYFRVRTSGCQHKRDLIAYSLTVSSECTKSIGLFVETSTIELPIGTPRTLLCLEGYQHRNE